MKEFFKGICIGLIIITIICVIFYGIAYLAFTYTGPDYKEGEYVMIYKVYYPDNPKTYTIKNDWPIHITSNRGTNRIKKVMHNSHFKRLYGSETIIETSAPIEVVSYTFKE